jgi:hypothetical protein
MSSPTAPQSPTTPSRATWLRAFLKAFESAAHNRSLDCGVIPYVKAHLVLLQSEVRPLAFRRF